MRIRIPNTNLVAIAMATALASCADVAAVQDDGPTDEVEAVASADEPLYIDKPHVWSKKTVSVCWRNRDSRAWVHGLVQEAVQTAWSFAADVELSGWGDCGASGADVKIDVGDNLPPRVVGGLGTALDHMELNFRGSTDSGVSYCGFGWPTETYETCMAFIAVHEFGHALGFAHEQNRSDTPASCTAGAQGSNGTETFGLWDGDSVMNYCNPRYAANPRLSGNDTLGAQKYYGVAPKYTAAMMTIIGT